MECIQKHYHYESAAIKTIVELFAHVHKNIPLPCEQNEPFEFTAVTLTGRVLTIKIRPFDTILRVKQDIYEQDGLMIDQQKIVFNGKQLQDNICVHEYGIKENSRIHLILRLRGGMFHASSSRSDYLTLSYKSKEILEKGVAMIKYMRNHYPSDMMDKIYNLLIESKENEIEPILQVIENYYVN
jgi:hypothetical protein